MAKIKKLKLGTELYDIEPTNTVPLSDVAVTSVAGKNGDVTLTNSDVGLGNVGNFKAVSTIASQGLTDTEKSNARANIGAGTSSLTLGTTATTAAKGNHTHTTTIAASSGTNELTLAHGTKYAITAGGDSFVFTMPSSGNTHNSHAIISGTKSDGSTQIKGASSSGDITLGDSGVTAGTYKRVTVNAKGIVVGGDNTDADTNTWRKIQLNGTDKLGTGTNTNPLNIKAGKDMSITESSGTFTFTGETNFEDFGTHSELGSFKYTISSGTYTRSQAFKCIIGIDDFYGFLNVVKNPSGTITSYDIIMWKGASIYYLTYVVSTSTWTENTKYLSTTDHTHSSYAASGHTHDYSNTYAAKSHTHSGYLTSHQTIKQDGITGATVNRFGTCPTAAATAAKTVSITNGTFSLETGARVTVKFTYANTANNPTLNVASKGAKNIFHKGAQITTGTNKSLLAGTVDFVFDGTQWHLVGNYIDSNTTYGGATQSAAGLMSPADKIKVDTLAAAANKGVDTSISAGSTSTNLPTSQAVAAFVEGKGYKTTDNNTTYTIATGDSNGQIKVTPSSGTAYNVAVKGLGSSAYITTYKAAECTTFTSDDGNCTPAAVKKAVGLFEPKAHAHSGLAYCTTAAATAAKTATMTGFALASGQQIFLRTTVKNSATSNVTLNVNSTGAKPVKIGNTSTAPTASNFPAGDYIANYDGTNWILTRIYLTDNNTTYGGGAGISVSGGLISNSGVISISTGSTNGTISVNTGGTSAEVAVKGLGSAAYTASTAYASSSHTHDYSGTYAASSHTHNYAGSSSAGGAATSANKVNSNLVVKLNSGTTEGTNLFTFNGSAAKTINITPSAIGAAASSHGTHVTAATVKSALGTGTGTSKYLREDGTWVTPPNTTYSTAQTSTAGIAKVFNFYNTNATYAGGNISSSPDSTNTRSINGITSTAGRYYGVEADKSGRLFVNVPWTDTFEDSKEAANGGTEKSLVTTGEKYIWNAAAEAAAIKIIPTASAGLISKDTVVGTITTRDIRANLRDQANLSIDSLPAATTSGRVYPVAVDKSGYLAVNVPWTNTTYTFNGAVSTIKDSNLTASRALISNSSGKVAVSDVTSTELGYLDGVTSNIQSQLDGKAASSHGTHVSYGGNGSATTVSRSDHTHDNYCSVVECGTYSEIGALKLDVSGGSYDNCFIRGILGTSYFWGFVQLLSSGYFVHIWSNDAIYRLSYISSTDKWTDDIRYYAQSNKLPSFSLSGTILTITDNN